MASIAPSQSFNELNSTLQPYNDLKAFERRLIETIFQQKPSEYRWRMVLGISLGSTTVSSFFWLQDSMNDDSSLFESLVKHYFFTLNCLILIVLFILGAHQHVIKSNIIVSRIREVLHDFALSCDDSGKLIVKQNFFRTNTSLNHFNNHHLRRPSFG